MSSIVLGYAGETPPEAWEASIYLCGPTPRSADVASWRPAAVKEIEARWTGAGTLVVFIPEARDGQAHPNYDDQRKWELQWGDRADVALFWIPRSPDMMGLTTNDEFGYWKNSGRAVLGTPADAIHVRYQRDFAAEAHVPVADNLGDTVQAALDVLGDGAARSGGHRDVPLLVWRTASFQSWLSTQEAAGNELRGGRLEWTCRVGPTKGFVLLWAFHAQVWVEAEGRIKGNEVVLGRPDIACVMAYQRAAEALDSRIVLIREFRSPARTPDGFVRELPGGSGFKPATPTQTAAAELKEETGIEVDADRIRVHESRQAAATLSAHHVHLFSCEFTQAEMDAAAADDEVHGVAADTERTYVEVHTYRDLLESGTVDWMTLGAIAQALYGS